MKIKLGQKQFIELSKGKLSYILRINLCNRFIFLLKL